MLPQSPCILRESIWNVKGLQHRKWDPKGNPSASQDGRWRLEVSILQLGLANRSWIGGREILRAARLIGVHHNEPLEPYTRLKSET